MTTIELVFVLIGIGTATSWLFRPVDKLEGAGMKRRQILTYLCFVGLLAIWLIGFLALNVDAEPPRPEHTKATMPENHIGRAGGG